MNCCLQFLSTSDFYNFSYHYAHTHFSGKTLIIFNKKKKATHMYFRDKYIYIKGECNPKFFFYKGRISSNIIIYEEMQTVKMVTKANHV